MAKQHIIDDKTRTMLLERLSHRAERLSRITAEGHPAGTIDTVVAMMAAHVAHTAMVLLGQTFAENLWSNAFDNLSESYGICRFCNARPLREDRTMCQVCWDQASSDDDISDEELIAMGLDDCDEEPASDDAVARPDGASTE